MTEMNYTLCCVSESRCSVSEGGMSFKGIEDTRVMGLEAVFVSLMAAISTRKNTHWNRRSISKKEKKKTVLKWWRRWADNLYVQAPRNTRLLHIAQ
jgi:hypothetical protein